MKKWMSFILTFALLCTMCTGIGTTALAANPTDTWDNHTEASFAGGAGTKEDPYLISTAGQLAKLAADINSGVSATQYNGMYFRLQNDLDLSAYRWIPIGNGPSNSSFQVFQGYFDGGNHTITGLYVDETATGYPAGLFGHISGYNAIASMEYVIKDLTVANATVKTTNLDKKENCAAGILTGTAFGPAYRVVNCHVSGTVDTNCYAGGLVGAAAWGAFEDCSAQVEITGGYEVSGGFVGDSYLTNYTSCSASGSVSGGWSTGGFAGAVYGGGTLDHCISETNITVNDWNAGGFVGYIGTPDEGRAIEFKNCLAAGDVTSTAANFEPKVGGFAGTNKSAAIDTCYFTGTLAVSHATIKPSGFVADNQGGSATNCMYDSTRNPGLQAVSTVVGDVPPTPGNYDVTGASTAAIKAAVKMNIYHNQLMPEEKDVTATYQAGAAAGTVYSVDVSWGSLEFTYTDASEGVWNPTTHAYENKTEAAWTCEEGADRVTVTNHSNAAVNATLSYQSAAGFESVSAVFAETSGAANDNKLELANAEDTTPANAPTAFATVAPSGALSKDTTAKTPIGTVTVTITDAAA